MDANTFTLKTQAALEAARQQAAARDQQAIEPEHVLLGLLADPEGVVFPLLHKLGLSPRTVRDRAADAADRLPEAVRQPRRDRGTAAVARPPRRCSTARGPRRSR